MTLDPKKRIWQRFIISTISMSIGIGIFYLFFRFSGLRVDDILESLGVIRIEWLLIATVSTFFHFYLSSLKWHIILRNTSQHSEEDTLSAFFCLVVTALGAALGQVFPLTVSTVFTRSVGAKLHRGNKMTRSALSTIYEQGMDLIVAFVIGLISIPAIAGWISFQDWILITATCLILVGIVLVYFLNLGLTLVVNSLGLLPSTWLLVHASRSKIISIQVNQTFAPRLTWWLYSLSIIRFINLAFRIWLISKAVNLPITASMAFYMMPLLQVAAIMSITPGNLGVAEWTITGILVAGGITSEIAVEFSVLFRIIIVGMVFFVNFFIILAYIVWQRHSKSAQSSQIIGTQI